MPYAVLLALGDPRSSEAGMWLDAVAWLRQELAERGFQVVVVDGEDVPRDLAHALEGVAPQRDVLVHISGRLIAPGVVRTGAGRPLPLQVVGEAIGGRSGHAAIFAELVHDGGPDRAAADEHVASILDALGVRGRGLAAMVGVRAATASVDGLALTRLCVDAARGEGHARTLVSWDVYHGALRMPASPACAQSFKLVRSDVDDRVSAPLPSFALEEPPTAQPEPLPSFALDEPPTAQPEPLPSFASGEPPTAQPEPLPSFALEEPPTALAPPSLDGRIAEATALAQWPLVVTLRRQRLKDLEPPRLRARELVAIARVLQAELDDAEGALAALDEARRVEPTRVAVLQALRRGHERLGHWEQAFEVIGALAHLSQTPSDRADCHFAQAQIATEKLGDDTRALTAIHATLQNNPAHEGALSLLEEAREMESWSGDVEEAEESGAFGAVDPTAHASAFEVHRREGRTDAALLAALALEELGAADVDHQVLVDQFRSVAPIRARGMLDDGAWDLLRVQGSREPLAALLSAMARAAVAARLEELVATRRLIALDPAKRLDETSTASIVRSFQWAARVLGLPCPALHLVDDVPGDIAAVPALDPATALGPGVLRGRSAKELAFLAGRHLAYYRPEHQVLVYFPTGEDIGRLLLATIDLVAPGMWPRLEDAPASSLREGLARHVTMPELTLAAGASGGLGSGADLAEGLVTWARGVELTAGRAGLLLCGDLATATALVRSESRAIGGLTAQDRRHDLIAFCSSAQHSELRSRFVVTAPESVQPPAMMTHADPPPPDLSIDSA